MNITLAQYAELAEWSDRMTAASNLMLIRSSVEDKAKVRTLITEWIERFEDLSYKAQQCVADVEKLAKHYSRRNPIPPA